MSLENNDQIYDRQRDLYEVSAPKFVCVVGVGGVGSWVALELALAGARDIVLIDDDIVEASNLNRTLFTTAQIGKSKVEAVAELILERRPDVNVMPFQCRTDNMPQYLKETLSGYLVFDCRDSIEPLDLPGTDPCEITGGYDGTSVTVHANPVLESVFGTRTVRYRVVPSYVGAPALLAAVIVNYACIEGMRTATECIVSFEIEDLLNILVKGARINNGE